MFELKSSGNAAPPSSAYTPDQISQAYGFGGISFGGVKGDGTGQTIAIVDAYDDPNIQNDLNAFDAAFGLPATTVTRVNQNGGTSLPSTDSTGGWAMEMSLDVEWAHAMAPGAKIVLVEANSASDNDLLAGVQYASSAANVVSMSWGGSEFSSQASYDGYFSHPGVTFVASSGDYGAPISWPASSSNVVSVGGTALTIGSGNSYVGESGWSGSGGGPSVYESQPSYQSGVVAQTTMRANPDVSYDASPSTGFAVYDSSTGGVGGWIQVGGTSAGAPQWAALFAIADQGRALSGQAPLNATGPQQVLTTLYAGAGTSEFHDVTTGTSTGSPNYSAGPGYDFVTGIGSPVANLVVGSLTASVTVASNDHLVITASQADTAGAAYSVTVTARNANGQADAGYTGTIAFTSTDAQAGLPGSYTFTSGDAGSHTFSLTLKTAGTQSITATDSATASITGTLSGIVVSPAAPSLVSLIGLPSSSSVGAPQTFTVSLYDAYGNLATNYQGTLQFTSTDGAAGLPGNYTFTAADSGSHSFSVTFNTAGTQTVTATDVASGLAATSSGVSVIGLAAPTGLSATAVSSTEIDLSWTGSSGATGYTIQRTIAGTNHWTQVALTAGGTTSYNDTSAAASTSYTYQVIATGGGMSSPVSNLANATTPAATTTTPATTETIWGPSYVPNLNAYFNGSYEVGVKFQSATAGAVTGMRFYQQGWMGGYSHVAHLWTATGQLLATAPFSDSTSTGWQSVNFAAPVSIAANTTYVVSFSTGGGYFGVTTDYFGQTNVTNGPLSALSNSTPGGDGVYQAGDGSFPNVSGNGMNFWADVLFSPTAGGSVAKPAGSTGSTRTVDTTTTGSAFVVTIAPADTTADTTAATRTGAAKSSANWPYRGTVPQALAFSSSRIKGFFSNGS